MNKDPFPFLYVALPVIDEDEFLPELVSCLRSQEYRNFKVFACVNQPDEWWSDPEKRTICEKNRRTLDGLRKIRDFEISVIDRTSPGSGWKGKKHGVGWARKVVMDAISDTAGEEDIILSLDADVTFSPAYFYSIAERFSLYPDVVGMAIPYFHKPVPDPAAYRAILRYEIYMRHYSLNLWRIRSPYSFTALGSAMACPVRAYRATGGMTPKMSGEDFYFLQKLRKYGKMLFWNPQKVYPAARFSNRVYFGTGPAMIRGNEGDWSSYPVYPFEFFDEIAETYELFPAFFEKTEETKVTKFLVRHLKEKDPFGLLRENARDVNQFVRACHEKFDGLRLLQYVKFRERQQGGPGEQNLAEYISRFHGKETLKNLGIGEGFSFVESDLKILENVRQFLSEKEEEYQVNSVPSLPGQRLLAV